ncbi:MAG TPA: formate dehydrogenase accessory protein FdhE [Spirochaetota bacterium]|nr:formate dehydrogenase accessory protein FdhE [Spirochaetota bacterium]HNT10632.1 formate dehydrogenase accessory protein FdhE [Spirochaetota bacterium]
MASRKQCFDEAVRAASEEFLTESFTRTYSSIFDAQDEMRTALKGSGYAPTFSESGDPIYSLPDLRAHDALALCVIDSLKRIAEIIRAQHPGIDFTPVIESTAFDREALSELVGSFASQSMNQIESLSARYRVGAEELVFLLTYAISPCYAFARQQYRGTIETQTLERYRCPFCGSLADMALLHQDAGTRYLHCSRCELIWQVKRVACAVCGNENIDDLGYFELDGRESDYRISYCDHCHGYIKTVLIPKFDDPLMRDVVIDNLMTANLDHAAIHRGYSRP